jgi:hypothetical protein
MKTVENLNNSPFSKDSINSKDIYVKAGFGPSTQNTINREVKAKFPHYSYPDLNETLLDDSIIAFAYLYKRLTFKVQF